MAEPHAAVHREQLLGVQQPVTIVEAQAIGGLEEEHGIADRLGGRDQQQPLRRRGQPLHPAGEGLLDAGRQGSGIGQPEAARQLRRVAAARQLEQRQRVAGRLADDAVSDAIVQRACDHRLQQRSRVVVAETFDHELRQPLQLAVLAGLAEPEDQRDRLGEQPARDEREDLRRGAVEPLRIVDQADQRLLLGGVTQETQHGQADQETIRCLAGPQAEGGGQRFTLRRGQPLEPVQQRRTQLLQPGERELHLGLDADRVEYPAARRPLGHVLQQRRLADTGLAAHHQRLALACANGADQLIEGRALATPAEQPPPRAAGVDMAGAELAPGTDQGFSRARREGGKSSLAAHHEQRPSGPRKEIRHELVRARRLTAPPTTAAAHRAARAERAALARRDRPRPLPVPVVVVSTDEHVQTPRYDDPALGGQAIEHDARALLGQVMGYVAVTVGFTALGAYLGRDLSGATGLVLFIATIPLVIGLNVAAARGREQLAIGLLFGLGLVLGLAVAPLIADYANADPSALWQAAGATAAFVAALGAYGYATRRDLSLVGPHALLGAAGPDRVRHRRDLRLDPRREHHLRRRRPRDLRRLHDLRLQPPAPQHPRRRRTDRGRDLPRHLQRLPALPRPVRRTARLNPQPKGVTMSTTQMTIPGPPRADRTSRPSR